MGGARVHNELPHLSCWVQGWWNCSASWTSNGNVNGRTGLQCFRPPLVSEDNWACAKDQLPRKVKFSTISTVGPLIDSWIAADVLVHDDGLLEACVLSWKIFSEKHSGQQLQHRRTLAGVSSRRRLFLALECSGDWWTVPATRLSLVCAYLILLILVVPVV